VSATDTRPIKLPDDLDAMIQTIPGGWTVTLADEWFDAYAQRLLIYGKRRGRESGEVLARIRDFIRENYPEAEPLVEQHPTNPPIVLGVYVKIPESWRVGRPDFEGEAPF